MTSSTTLTAIGAALCVSTLALGQCAYEVTVISAIPQSGGVAGWGIGDDGTVVGSVTWLPTLTDRPMRWSPKGGVELLPLPEGSNEGRALRIAADGTIVGWFGPARQP